jgi:hypothetical protein
MGLPTAGTLSLTPDVVAGELDPLYRRAANLLGALGQSVGVGGPHDEEAQVERRVERALSRWKPQDRTVAGDFSKRADVAAAIERALDALRQGDLFTTVREIRRARDRRLVPITEAPNTAPQAPPTAIQR